METTDNYELNKPGYDDQEDVAILNDNMDIIDGALKAHDDLLEKLPISRGGTNATTASAARTNLGLGTLATKDTAPVANGGTGATTASGARTNLGLGAVATMDTIPITNGGTGASSVAGARNALGLGNTSGALPIANGGTGQTTVAAARNALGLGNTSGALPVANGGTGQTTLAAARNAMGLGNTTGALPVANGGTGQTSLSAVRSAMGLGNTTGALPIANGGTGATTSTNARTNLGLGSMATRSTIFQTKTYTYNWTTLAADALLSVTGTNFGVSTPSGYSPVAAISVLSGQQGVPVDYFNVQATGSSVVARFQNGSTAITGSSTKSAKIVILYVLTAAIS